MRKLATLFTKSCQEAKQVRTITVCAMLGAIAVVLGYYSIEIGPYIRIGFADIPNRLVDYLFGPVVGGCFGGILDLLKFMMKPSGQFFPGFTLTAITGGILYGSMLYKRPFTFRRVLAAKLVVVVICNVLMNTLWMSMLYGKAFMVLLPARTLKNMVMWPVDSLLLFTIVSYMERAGVLRRIRSRLAE